MSQTIPAELRNVTVTCKANIFFDGKVVSHVLVDADGAKRTLGLIYPGSYSFGTAAPERMDIVAGACRVRLAGTMNWTDHPAGSTFHVPGDSRFEIAVDSSICEYICTFG